MSNDDVPFFVSLSNVVLNKDELAELMYFLRSKKFLYREYKGTGKGFDGGEYDFSLVKCDEKSRVEISPVNDTIWFYLNTFGKETK